ncbi:hypothetical protein [Ammoniphilus sp. YIM 78166]|uniref:hypothetical protein n=1 Tax=Ammoniphilus sp. YIM 78166 TaxID=1644106 RepID=UPI0010701B25|nr:hypothetical protein [Ammoniphilus sp. YIM 78166]
MNESEIHKIRDILKKGRMRSNNPTNYPLIGEGAQGAVFLLSPYHCIKIYGKKHHAKRELEALILCQSSTIVPRVYSSGTHFIMMEYLDALTLSQFLERHQYLSESLADKIIFLLKEMKRLEFTRIDAAMRHIFVMENGTLKVIDLVNSYKKVRHKPELLFKGLKELGMLSSFLYHLERFDPNLFKQWT